MQKIIASFIALTFLIISPLSVSAGFKKTRIAVLDFQIQGEGYETADMGKIVAEWLITAFVKNGRFEVIERSLLKKILEEQKLVMTGVVNESSASQIGKLLGVEVVISGSIMRYQKVLEVNARIIDVENASVVAAEGVKSTSVTRLEDMVYEMAEKIINDFPLKGYIVQRDGKNVVIDLGGSAGVKKGMQFIVYKEGNVIKHPKTGEILDVQRIETGRVEIVGVRGKISEAKIIKEQRPGSLKYGHMVISVVESQTENKPRLFVNTDPQDARVRILNINPPYRRGMELKAGKYHIEVSAPGHKTKKEWIYLQPDQDMEIDIRLVETGYRRPKKIRASEPLPPPSGRKMPQSPAYGGVQFNTQPTLKRVDMLLQEAARQKAAGNYQWKQQTKKVARLLKNLLKQNRRSPVVYYYYGKYYMTEGLYKHAVKYLTKAIRFDKNYSAAHELLGDAYYFWGKQGRNAAKLGKRALNAYKTAAATGYKNNLKAMIYYKMGNIYAELLININKANNYWQKAVSTAPGSTAARLAKKKLT